MTLIVEPPRPTCKVKSEFCSGQVVRLLTGPKKDDPKFWCCIACRAMLNRSGVKLKNVVDLPKG